MKEIVIQKNQEGQTIYKFVRKYFSSAPLSFIEKLFRIRDVKVNKVRVNKTYVVKKDDLVQIYVTDQQLEDFNKPQEITSSKQKPNIIYEDENILVCNKPSGLLVHGDEKEKRITLTNIVLSYLYDKGEYDPKDSHGFTPGPAHRIDRNTSGLVIFGKTIKALQELEDLFKERDSLHKYYYALVCGHPDKKGKIDKPLYKDENKGIVYVRSIEKGGKSALTTYEVVEEFNKYSLVEACILTGRTHQIRVHFASIDHPLLGDSKYGNFNMNKEFSKKFDYQNQFLHAHKMKFDELDGVLSYLSNKEFIAPLDKKETKIIEALRREK
jgi:23S rRNA pseudouridine955/2504/2580 synthase